MKFKLWHLFLGGLIVSAGTLAGAVWIICAVSGLCQN